MASQAATGATDYDTIIIGSGEHHEFTISDGESFTNKLIDISADGATFELHATGSGWEIKNVGVRGVWDPSDDEEVFSVSVSSGGRAVIDNVYFADGIENPSAPGPTGIYVKGKHAGVLEINNFNVRETSNGIYAAVPGYPDDNPHGIHSGGQGVVHITNSYATNCLVSDFRIGTTDSTIQNCVGVGGDRGAWAMFNDGQEVIDCDFSGHMTNRADGDVVCGENVDWGPNANAEVTMTDTYFGTTAPGDQGINYPGNIIGQSVTDSPRRTEPDQVQGVPLTAEEAAAGTSSSDGTSSDDSTNDSSSSMTTDQLRIKAADGASTINYEFTVDGDIVEGVNLEDNDTWSTTDGQTTATGAVGNGWSDGFEIDGKLLAWSADTDASQYTVLLNGTEVDVSQFNSDELRIQAADGAPTLDYEFTVDGDIVEGVNLEDNDTWSTTDGQTTATGAVGDGWSDTYRIDGSIADWSASVDSSQYRVLVNGSEIDPIAMSATKTLRVETANDAPLVEYDVTVEGTLIRGSSAENTGSVAGDSISESNGQTTVSGATGRGYTDDYEFQGSLLEWNANVDSSYYQLFVDGDAVDPARY